MPEDNILSEEYLDTGIPRYFVTLSVVDNFAKNPTKSKKGDTACQHIDYVAMCCYVISPFLIFAVLVV